MQTPPTGWPAESSVETIPEFQIVTDSPAVPDGVAPVASYQIRRDLTGGGLPGAARGGSGFSVAEGSVTLQQQGTPVTPWAKTPVRPGGAAVLQAVQTEPSFAGERVALPLGSFLVNDVSGADSEGEITLGLIEAQRRLDGEITFNMNGGVNGYTPGTSIEGQNAMMDASTIICEAAKRAGFTTNSTPSIPKATLIADMPLQGSPMPQIGVPTDLTTAKFGSAQGRVGMVSGVVKVRPNPYGEDITYYANCTIHFEVAGTGCTIVADNVMVIRVDLVANTITINPGKEYGGTFPIPATRIGNAYTIHSVATAPSGPTKFYIKTPSAQSWTLLGTIAGHELRISDYVQREVSPGVTGADTDGWVSAVTIWGSNGTALPTVTYPDRVDALIEATGSLLTGVFTSDQSGRDVMQDIARATMGAAWLDETGTLVYRNAESMRTGSEVETIVADAQLEDLPWRISREDTADRIEFTYTPANIERDPDGKLTLWEATEKTYVAARKTITVTADLEQATTDRAASFLPIWDTTTAGSDGERMSRWAAAYNPDSSGERPPDDAIKVEAKVSGSKATLTITNNTNRGVWLVDGTGNPCLILRTTLKISAGEQETIEWGEPAETALNPFQFDAGQWVQDADTARSMLDWLASQMQTAQAVIEQVNVKPNLARQLGDIVLLTENQLTPDHKPLKTKALITGSDLDGDANGYTTTLNLAMLAVTFGDVGEWAAANSVTTFGNLDTKLTSLGLTTFDQLDAWLAAGNTY